MCSQNLNFVLLIKSKMDKIDPNKKVDMKSKTKSHWYNMMGQQEKSSMEKKSETEVQTGEKKSKKVSKEPLTFQSSALASESVEPKSIVKITFEGEAAQKILKCESELRERLSKPEMGKIIGNEILAWTDKRWSEIVEENTDIDYFFAQIKKCPDRSKSIKLLKTLSEKLKNETSEGASVVVAEPSLGLSVASPAEVQSNAG